MKALRLLPLLALIGCSSNIGREARPDTFDEGMVNRPQTIRIVQIRHVSQAYMVEDSRNAPAPTKHASSSGLLLDLVALPINIGSIVATGHSVTGSRSNDGEIVKGVGIDYTDRTDPYAPVMRSTQVGKTCEYRNGAAELVHTETGETRIQPNSEC